MNTALQTLDDARLLGEMLRSNNAAWVEFQRRFDRLVWQQVTRVSRGFTKVLTRQDLEEMRGDFYASLVMNDMHKLRAFDPERGLKLSTWVALLAANTCRDYLRGIKRRPSTTTISPREAELATERDAFEQAASRERGEQLRQAFESLPERDRGLLWMLYIEDSSPAEIAEACEISPKTVYTRCHRLRAILRERCGSRCLSVAA